MGVSLLNFFDLKPLNTSKRALNTNPPFFWDTLYIHESKHKPTFHIQFSPRLGECGGILPNLNSCWCSSLLAPCWPVTFLHYTAALFHTCDQWAWRLSLCPFPVHGQPVALPLTGSAPSQGCSKSSKPLLSFLSWLVFSWLSFLMTVLLHSPSPEDDFKLLKLPKSLFLAWDKSIF